jgi:uncharacterized DUF497 family protein
MKNVKWIWDPDKERQNKANHNGLSFSVAELVFDDPAQLSMPDPHESDERWRTLGQVGSVVLFVVHTMPEFDPYLGQEVGRIISARKATVRERRAYEHGW